MDAVWYGTRPLHRTTLYTLNVEHVGAVFLKFRSSLDVLKVRRGNPVDLFLRVSCHQDSQD